MPAIDHSIAGKAATNELTLCQQILFWIMPALTEETLN